jgi:hypothetical protein
MPGPAGPPQGIEHSFQREHLLAAGYFVGLAKRIETRGAAAVGPQGMTRHRACVTGAIVSSVAFLESSINELYLEFERAGDDGTPVPTRAHTQLATLWPSVEGAPVTLRYQVALRAPPAGAARRGAAASEPATATADMLLAKHVARRASPLVPGPLSRRRLRDVGAAERRGILQ